jgi:hypothetical protein
MAAGSKKRPPLKFEAPAPQKPNKVEKLIQDVTNRYRVTAREARDIVTAVSTAGKSALTMQVGDASQVKKAGKNIVKQVKETGVAAATGRKGTTSAKSVKNPKDPFYGTSTGKLLYGTKVVSGKKRK